jgi:hypothetical protein
MIASLLLISITHIPITMAIPLPFVINIILLGGSFVLIELIVECATVGLFLVERSEVFDTGKLDIF